jgi:hypothetical protein
VWLVHPKFASYSTSGLTADVEPEASNRVSLVVTGFVPGRQAQQSRP